MNSEDVAFYRGMLDASRDDPNPYERGTAEWERWLDGYLAYVNPGSQRVE
jgi:hypothetical protein